MRPLTAIPLAALLTACVTTSDMAWRRVDERSIRTDPVLLKQARIGYAICRGEVAKAVPPTIANRDRVDEIMRGCMAGKGYVLKPRPPGEEPISLD